MFEFVILNCKDSDIIDQENVLQNYKESKIII